MVLMTPFSRFLWILAGFLTSWPFLAQVDVQELRTVRAYWPEVRAIEKVVAEMEPEHLDRQQGFLIVEVNDDSAAWLESLGFALELDIERTTLRQYIYNHPQPLLGQTGIPGFECYFTVTETAALLQDWAQDYPDLVEIIDVGDSWRRTQGLAGFDLQVLKLTSQKGPEDKPAVMVLTGLHARELAPVGLITTFAEQLLLNYDQDPVATYLLDEVSFHFLVQANPDGRTEAEAGDLWRKNTNDTTCSFEFNIGVDLNRNFPFGWACCGGSSGSGCSETYRGANPLSEPETEAIFDYAASVFTDLRNDDPTDPAPSDTPGVFMDIHSYGEWVLWPFGFDATFAPNDIALQTFGRRMAYFNQYSPEKSSQSFTTDGTTDDFAYGTFGVPAYTLEVGTTFFQNCDYFESTLLPENLPLLYEVGLNARAPYLWPAGPRVSVLNVSMQGAQVQLQGTVADNHFENSNGVEPVQTVSEVVFYLHLPPWRGGEPQTCLPTDGVFDSAVEGFSANLGVANLPQGKHRFYIQARDSLGNWGAIYPGSFEIGGTQMAQIVGTVSEIYSESPLRVDVVANGVSTQSDASGSFLLNVQPGQYDLRLSGRPYLEAQAEPVSVENAQQISRVIKAVPRCNIWEEGAESGALSWQLNGWQLSDEKSETGAFAFNDSPGSVATSETTSILVSPVFDLSSVREPELTFYHQFNLAGTDQARIEINLEESGWQALQTFAGQRANFTQVQIDLPEASGAQLRFVLETGNAPGDGWLVDRIRVAGASYTCLRDRVWSDVRAGWSQSGYDVQDLIKLIGHEWARGTAKSLGKVDNFSFEP